MIEDIEPSSLEAIYATYISITSSSVRVDIIKLVPLEIKKSFRGINKQDNKEVYISFDDVEDGIRKSGTYENGLVKIEDVFETEEEATEWAAEILKSKNTWLKWSREYFEVIERLKELTALLENIDAVLKQLSIKELELASNKVWEEYREVNHRKRELEELINPEPIDELDLVSEDE